MDRTCARIVGIHNFINACNFIMCILYELTDDLRSLTWNNMSIRFLLFNDHLLLTHHVLFF